MSDNQAPRDAAQPPPVTPGTAVEVEMFGGPEDGARIAVQAAEDGHPPRYFTIKVPTFANRPGGPPVPNGARHVRCELILRRGTDAVGRYGQRWCYAWPAGA